MNKYGKYYSVFLLCLDQNHGQEERYIPFIGGSWNGEYVGWIWIWVEMVEEDGE